MHLTRFRINTTRRGARKLLSSPQAMHAAVLSGFARPEDHTRADARTLWRVDQHLDRQVTLYILSPGQPDLTHLVEQAGWPTTETWQTRPYQPFLDILEAGQQRAFRLTANPTRSGRKTANAPDTQRFGAVTVAQQAEWLRSRGEQYGFSIARQADGNPNLVIHRRQTRAFTRNRGERPVTLVTATYDGVLAIDKVESFRTILTTGIGHAKAYGCGLITLASVR
jgi:CRISPR system Cascade subunit CasE